MFDQTQLKIIDATMSLVMEYGYTATTTKDIAKKAGVNECTIFRKFKGKKDIILASMSLSKWNPGLSIDDFTYQGDLEKDLINFSKVYMSKVTPHMVKLSVGLRHPDLESDTSSGILKIPQVFKKVIFDYLVDMYNQGKIVESDFEGLSMAFLSLNFGFVFLDAYFGQQLTTTNKDGYIESSVRVFINGITKR